MTCDNCAHGKVCAYRKTSQHLTDIENHCDLFLDCDRTVAFPVAVGEPIWIFERDQIEKYIIYKVRLTVENARDIVVKGETDTRVQIFAFADSGRVIEVLPKHIGQTAFFTFEEAERAAIYTDGSAEQVRYNMFRDYLIELQKIEEYDYMDDAEILDNFIKMRCGDVEHWMDVYPDNANNCAAHRTKHDIIGFWILGQNGSCHPDADYFIAETYIRPEYRREGIMSDRISDWIKTYGGKFCLFVLSKNEVAKKFWKNVFDRCGYEPYELSDVADDMNGHLIQFGYKPKE